MKLTKSKLKQIIKEELKTLNENIDPYTWAKDHNLQVETDNEGQIIIYVDERTADSTSIPLKSDWAVEKAHDGYVIYTGKYQRN